MEAIYLYLPIVLLALPVFTKYYLNKIQNLPPSPFPTIPILGHLHLIRNPIHATLSKISARYGPVLLLKFGSRRVVLVSSPAAAEECFKRNDLVFANRPQLLAGKHFGYNYSNLAWAPHGKRWRTLRTVSCLDILQPCHQLQRVQAVRADEVRLQIRQLFRKSASGDEMKEVQMKKVFLELVLNVMMRMFAGKRYFQEDVEGTKEAQVFARIVMKTFEETGETNLGDFFPVLERLGVSGATEERMKTLQVERDSFVQKLINEINDNMEKTKHDSQEEQNAKNLIELLLEKQREDPNKYGDDVIKSSVLVLLAAGTDTSAGTMEWAMSLLLNNPQILDKAQEEIDSVVGQDRLLEEPDIEHLPYLDSIIKETLRMYPAGPMLVPHESSKDQDCTVGGYHIPGGTMLMVNMWAIQNDPNIWEEPRKFMPERFKGQEKDEFKLLPFGYGRRSCPGEGLAMRMVGLALGSFIQCFEWERVSEEMVDMTEGAGLTLLKDEPLVAKCRPRHAMKSVISQI